MTAVLAVLGAGLVVLVVLATSLIVAILRLERLVMAIATAEAQARDDLSERWERRFAVHLAAHADQPDLRELAEELRRHATSNLLHPEAGGR